ncbi:aspartate kinase [Halalkalibacillus sediminis]|uniref:Aspartokinase n=1 Tax=Halalkalibacillus sediminis TaxID=2018042 RepID=A0A2I0QWI6_9BACI|nr:aspartate kinase [Halalkalibacillus sediminis]PKR78674.1 aspartate kinase [Halalkalibacillus sediminis]
MGIIVQKFGGTSVRNSEAREHAFKHIKNALEEGHQVVVVVSAMGRAGEPYATDTLLSLVDHPKHMLTSREVDMLMSCGEIISSVVFSNELKKMGMTSTALSGAQAGFLTTNDFTNARINKVDPSTLQKYLKTNDVIVVAGFQGEDENGNTTTLGRGGSDTSAVALGAALNADYVDIFTDVDGIKTADPVIVKHAETLEVMTYNEIVHLAYQGSKVLHPRAVEIAMQEKIPIRVRSTYTEDTGTLVTAKKDGLIDRSINDRIVTGIAHVSGLTQIKVEATGDVIDVHDQVFKHLADAGISVDFFNIFAEGITFTVPSDKLEKTKDILGKLQYQFEVVENCAKVSAVGAGIQGVPGVASKVVSSLARQKIKILQSADSHTTIWVLIKEADLEKAVIALHDEFLTE